MTDILQTTFLDDLLPIFAYLIDSSLLLGTIDHNIGLVN